MIFRPFIYIDKTIFLYYNLWKQSDTNMTKHYKTKTKVQTHSQTKRLSVPEQIEQNKQIISKQLSGSNVKRLNNLNWIRHEISYTEQQILFIKPTAQQQNFFDYSCSKGLGEAYDYIIDKKNDDITSSGVRQVHYLICHETYIQPGTYRQNTNILDIYVNGVRIYAPDSYYVPSLMEKTIYDWKNSKKSDPMRAFDLHYDIIMLQPFDDCNKRTARIVMNWALVLSGYRPIIFNRKSDKENYIKAIKNMAMGDSKSYYKYMYDCMKHSQQQIIEQLKRSKIQ